MNCAFVFRHAKTAKVFKTLISFPDRAGMSLPKFRAVFFDLGMLFS